MNRFLQRCYCAVFLLLNTLGLAQYAPDDEVRLRKDTPLHKYRDGTLGFHRDGKQGEVFKVLKYDAKTGNIYVESTASDGKRFALTVTDRACELLPRDPVMFLQRGSFAFRKDDLVKAREQFVKAAATVPSQKAALDMATNTELIQKAVATLKQTRLDHEKGLKEVERLTKNAAVANRRDPFGSNDPQRRAAAILTQAAQLRQQLAVKLSTAEQGLIKVLEDSLAASERLIASGFLTTGLNISEGLDDILAKNLPGRGVSLHHKTIVRREQSASGETRTEVEQIYNPTVARMEVRKRIAVAEAAIPKVQAAIDAKRFFDAAEALKPGLESEPGRAELLQMKTHVQATLDRVQQLLSISNARIHEKNYQSALTQLQQAEELCADSKEAADLSQKLAALLGGKTK